MRKLRLREVSNSPKIRSLLSGRLESWRHTCLTASVFFLPVFPVLLFSVLSFITIWSWTSVFCCWSFRLKISNSHRFNEHLLKNENHPMDISRSSESNVLSWRKIFLPPSYYWSCCYYFYKVNVKVKVKSLSHVWLVATPWTGAYHAPPSMGFFGQEYRSGLLLPSSGDLPDPGIEPGSPTL